MRARDSGGEEIGLLPISGLVASGDARVSDQFRLVHAPRCFITNGDYTDSIPRLQDMVIRISHLANDAVVFGSRLRAGLRIFGACAVGC